MKIVRSWTLIMMAAVAFSAGAFTANTWQAVDGDWNGKYSDVRHWSLGHLPTYDRGEDAVFINRTGAQYDVEMDVELVGGDASSPAFFKVGNSNVLDVQQPVRFYGNGKIAQYHASSALYMYDNVQAIFDGNVLVELFNSANAFTNRSIKVCGNATVNCSDTFYLCKNDSFEMSGGSFNCHSFNPSSDSPCTFKVTGGDIVLAGFGTTFSEEAIIEFAGGRITSADKLTDARLMPRGGAVYDVTAGTAYDVKFETPGTNVLSGTLFATNCAASDGGWLRLEQGNNVLYGGGSVSVRTLYLAEKTYGNVLDISRLNVGSLFHIKDGEFIVPRDITLGAFGDYKWYNTYCSYQARYLGTVTFETLDCFDGVTAHNVAHGGLIAIPGSAFRIVGPGSVNLGLRTNEPNESVPGFRSVEVCDGASAGITNTAYEGVFRMGQLSLGNGAKLRITPNKNSIEAAEVSAANASLQADLTGLVASDGTAMTGALLVRPVLVSGESECNIPLENVTLSGPLGTWRVKKVGGAIYLRDDTARVRPETLPQCFWTGAENGDWDNPGNWHGNAVPSSTDRVFFGVCDTTNVVTIPAGGVTVETLSGAGYTGSEWFRSSEPYVFRGGKITITREGRYDQNSAFYDCGLMPKYFECDVELSASSAGVAPLKSVSFLGGFTAKSYRARGGNAYFGGTATVQNLELVARFVTAQRHTSVTILPGGKFTATAENCTVNADAYLHILGGGEMTLNGTKFAYVGAPTLTNTVDGTLTINAPYTIDADQCFVGTGRVDIASTYSSGNVARQNICGGLRLNLGSGFRTVTSANAAGAVVVAVPDFREATLGLKGDVTYGPADGVTPSTAAADRALSIGYRAKLTIDTSDPDDGTPRTLTLKDPVIGTGDLTITGGGKVVLTATGNRVGKFTLAGGTLAFGGGEFDGWTDILTADSVAGLEGHVEGDISYSIMENGDGSVTLRVRRKRGTMLILR